MFAMMPRYEQNIARDPLILEYFILVVEILKNNPGLLIKKD